MCYYESDKLGWEPKLIVVTTKQILLNAFMANDEQDAHRFNLKRNSFNLTQVKESDFAPFDLEESEEVSWIAHFSKTDRVFYASHTANYNQVFIKELWITDSTREVKLVPDRYRRNMLEETFSAVKNKVLDARNHFISNKRLTVTRAQDNHNIGVRAIRNVIPYWMNITVVRKVIVSVTVDQDRNWLYVLVNKLVPISTKDSGKRMDCFNCTEVEVYDCGILGDRFKQVARITQERLAYMVHQSTGKGLFTGNLKSDHLNMPIIAANPVPRQLS